jgi:hypothetical protein
MAQRPLCFVLMPFGSKPDPSGRPDIPFDQIYETGIRPAIDAAGMQPIRADEEKLGGIIHKAMFERLLVCKYAIADLTTSNPNVLYELGVRHTARPGTTLTIYAQSTPLPFDVRILRQQRYALGAKNQFTTRAASTLRKQITEHLEEMHKLNRQLQVQDSPLFELVPGWSPELLTEAAADAFRADVRVNEKLKDELGKLRVLGQEAGERDQVRTRLAAIRAETFADGSPDIGVLTELILAHRSIIDWSGMIDVYVEMPEVLQQQAPIRQQAAFAYNRRAELDGPSANADRTEAITMLEQLEKDQGPSSETSGILGRIYKAQWLRARDEHDQDRARERLNLAVRAYERGFETDWQDIYPGINAVTLLEAQGTQRALNRKDELLPVVRFAVKQRLRAVQPEYWDFATLLEIHVLDNDFDAAEDLLRDVVAASTEHWQRQSTTGNLLIIESVRRERGQDLGRLPDVINEIRPPG